jgi:hypothetical protein
MVALNNAYNSLRKTQAQEHVRNRQGRRRPIGYWKPADAATSFAGALGDRLPATFLRSHLSRSTRKKIATIADAAINPIVNRHIVKSSQDKPKKKNGERAAGSSGADIGLRHVQPARSNLDARPVPSGASRDGSTSMCSMPCNSVSTRTLISPGVGDLHSRSGLSPPLSLCCAGYPKPER